LRNGQNLVLCTDKELVAKSKEMGFNLSKKFENRLRHATTQFSTGVNGALQKDGEGF
jgi:hypothetical protein